MEKGITKARKRSLKAICCIKEPGYLYYVVVIIKKEGKCNKTSFYLK